MFCGVIVTRGATMGLKKQIQLISFMIVFVLVFIFMVTSFSKEFYFLAYGNRENTRTARLAARGLTELETREVEALEAEEEETEEEMLVEIEEEEVALGGETEDTTVVTRSTETSERTDYIGAENEEGNLEEHGEWLGEGETDEALYMEAEDEVTALPNIYIEDGAERQFVVLMFHDIVESSSVPDTTFLTKSTFENILALIKERGYQTIDVQDLIDFVEGVKDLPEKSVMLTFDDGYYSNYRLVYPILKRENMKAIFFPIGVSVGKKHYKGTELEMMRHYSIEDMQEMQASGLVEFGSHTYDMHQNVKLEAILGNKNPRVTIVKMDSDTEEDYINLFRRDIALNNEVYKDSGINLLSFSCPRGGHDELSVKLLKEAGFRSIFISKTGLNTVVKGEPETLYLIKRYNMSEDSDYSSLLQ